jgi:hypothetical protein
MMEEQIQRAREETRGAKEMVGRVKEVLERVAGDSGDEKRARDGAVEMEREAGDVHEGEEKEEEEEEKMVWNILEREVGYT